MELDTHSEYSVDVVFDNLLKQLNTRIDKSIVQAVGGEFTYGELVKIPMTSPKSKLVKLQCEFNLFSFESNLVEAEKVFKVE